MSDALGAGTALYNSVLHGQITLENARIKRAELTPEQEAEFSKLQRQFGRVL